MTNTALILFGIILLIISLATCVRVIRINTVKKLQIPWLFMLGLIFFFLVGYIAYLVLSATMNSVPINSFLISAIFFFGAIFVLSILTVSYELIASLTQKTYALNEANKTLTDAAQKMTIKQTQLEEAENKLLTKNSELQQTLEDFYTLRIGAQRDIELGKFPQENQKIKDRLEALKKE